MARLGRRELISLVILVLIQLFLLSCKTAKVKKPVVTTPVEQTQKPATQVQLPVLPAPTVQTLAASPQPIPLADPADQIIRKSQEKFIQGERNLKAGFLERAKKDFDDALEVILRSGIIISQNELLQKHYEHLVDQIHTYELAALKEGDGFSEERVESAPIDEIATGEVPLTFDPNSKRLAEETVKQTRHDLPLTINDTVLRYVDYFQTRGRKAMEVGLERAGRYRDMISRILAEEGVPQDLIFLCQAESAFRPLALSRAKCKGLWQFAAARGLEYGLKQNWWVDERSDPEKSTRAAAKHLKDLHGQFGDWTLAMAAYNTGPGNIERAIQRTGYADFWELLKRGTLHPETANYIPIITAMAIIAKDPEKYGFDVTPDPTVRWDKVKIGSPLDLRLVAESLDIRLEQVTELNPQLRRLTTPRNDPEFSLYLPEGTQEKFLAAIGSIPEDMRVTWRIHRAEEGESLSEIARKYRTQTSAISQANNLDPDHKIQIGDKLIIPVTPGRVATTATAGNGSRIRYTVQRGDTVASISRDFEVTISQIRRWNKIKAKTPLRPGRVLVLYVSSEKISPASYPGQTEKANTPQKSSAAKGKQVKVLHKVKKGDTLYAIAVNYRTTIESIRNWNNLSSQSNLRVGDHLTIFLDH